MLNLSGNYSSIGWTNARDRQELDLILLRWIDESSTDMTLKNKSEYELDIVRVHEKVSRNSTDDIDWDQR